MLTTQPAALSLDGEAIGYTGKAINATEYHCVSSLNSKSTIRSCTVFVRDCQLNLFQHTKVGMAFVGESLHKASCIPHQAQTAAAGGVAGSSVHDVERLLSQR